VDGALPVLLVFSKRDDTVDLVVDWDYGAQYLYYFAPISPSKARQALTDRAAAIIVYSGINLSAASAIFS
jgi:hypothetical protein